MFSTPRSKVSWPHLTTPHWPTSGVFAEKKPDGESTRNSWVQKTPASPNPSPLQPLTDGAHKVAQSTKRAWHKTVNALTPGEPTASRSDSSRIAQHEVDTPWWKRMFGAKAEVQQPQTIPEWMAQKRLDP